MTEKKTALESR